MVIPLTMVLSAAEAPLQGLTLRAAGGGHAQQLGDKSLLEGGLMAHHRVHHTVDASLISFYLFGSIRS